MNTRATDRPVRTHAWRGRLPALVEYRSLDWGRRVWPSAVSAADRGGIKLRMPKAARETCGAGAETDPQDSRLRNPAGQRGGLLYPRRHLRLVELVVLMDVEVARFLVLGLAGGDRTQ